MCVCAHTSLCLVLLPVSVPETGVPQGVVLHFHSFINSPLAPSLFAKTDMVGGRAYKQMEVNGFKGEEKNTCFLKIIFIQRFKEDWSSQGG